MEPQLWQDLVLFLYNYMNESELLLNIIPVLSDIFVFSYPVFLVILYLYWIFKQKLKYKIWAIYIFFSTLFAIILTISVQLFIHKKRPIYYYWFIKEQAETLLHNFLPSSSFPSDHATVSFAIATATLLWWLKTKNKTIKIVSFFFFSFAVIMGGARIMTAVHRPTDIIAGALVWIIASWILFQKNVAKWTEKNIFKFLINLEEKITSFLWFKS